MRHRRRRAQELRQAVDCLPARTRQAMLEALTDSRIIVGAYTDDSGGVCPMLAAHRNGGRTSLASFARAWDRYTEASKQSRPATARELRTLRAMLEASLLGSQADPYTAAAERAERASRARGERHRRSDTGERNRAPELRARPGWAWLRVFRRYDDYEAALARANAHTDERELERVN